MDYTEIIKSGGIDYANKNGILKGVERLFVLFSFKAGAEYYKQITEIEKLSAKIETCETILSSYSLTKSDKQSLRQVIKAEKKLREGIINELKLKP